MNQQETFEVVRGARTGGPFSFSEGWSGLTAWVSPTTRKPTVGTLQTYTSGTLLLAGQGRPPSYAYNLDFPGPAGIIPPQQFTVSPATWAAVTEHYYQDVPTGQRRAGSSSAGPWPSSPSSSCRSSRSPCRRCRPSTSRPAATCCGACRR